MRVPADTFCWIALTDSTDSAHERARRITVDIVTADEVLTFFCGAPQDIRSEVALTVRIFCKTRR